MEEQRKKYLINRIKKQQLILRSDFDHFKRAFQSRSIPDERNESYIQLVSGLVGHNNQFALNLFEYLQKSQITDICQRSTAIFNDLLSKYKKAYQDWKDLEESKEVKQTRQICQICHQKIQSKHIENIKIVLARESQARSNLIKKLIEQTEKQRVKPLFTKEEDETFKQELEKVLKQKQMSIQSNLQESNVFLETVTKQMSDFMVSFRNDFASWEHSSVEENKNWATTMKSYLNKKLANSFQQKLPNWIKKMHNFFVISQPVKPKIFYANRQVQTFAMESPGQAQLKKQVQQLQKKLDLKRQMMQQLYTQIDMEKARNQNLQRQLARKQKYMFQKIYEAKQDKKTQGKSHSKNLSAILCRSDQNQNLNTNTSNQKNLQEIEKGVIIPAKTKKKVQKLFKNPKNSYSKSLIFQQVEKENRLTEKAEVNTLIGNKEKILQNSQIKQLQKTNPRTSLKQSQADTYCSNDNIILKKTSLAESQGVSQLKKRGFNREKRQELINEHKIDIEPSKGSNSKLNINTNNKIARMPNIHLKQEVKKIGQILKQSSVQKKNLDLSHIKIIENEIIVSEKSNRSLNKEKMNSCFQESKDKPILNNRAQSGYEVCFQGQIQKKMKKYLQNNKKGRNIIELKELENQLRNYLDSLASPTQITKHEKASIFPKMILKEQFQRGKILQNSSIMKAKHKLQQKQDRYCKSLHLDRSTQTKPLKLPRLAKNEYHNFQAQETEQKKLFMDNFCLNLFIDSETAYFYENSLRQATRSKQIIKPTAAQLQAIEELFSELEGVKRINNSSYTQIVSFLKHPFTALKCQFLTVDVVNELVFSSFCNQFFKILWLHKKCIKKQGDNFCAHINLFTKQIKSFKLK